MKGLFATFYKYIAFTSKPTFLIVGGLLSYLTTLFDTLDLDFLYALGFVHFLNIVSKMYSIIKSKEKRFDLCYGFQKTSEKAILFGIVFIMSQILFSLEIKGVHPVSADYFARYSLLGLIGTEAMGIYNNLKVFKIIEDGYFIFKNRGEKK